MIIIIPFITWRMIIINPVAHLHGLARLADVPEVVRKLLLQRDLVADTTPDTRGERF
jgi:hypothetical protein